MKVRILLPLVVLALAACGGATVGEQDEPTAFRELAKTVRAPLEASNASIEKAKLALSGAAGKADPDLVSKLSEAQTAVNEVIKQQESVVTQFELVIKLGQQLQKEKDALTRDKEDLEKRERLFSTGFYAALITALIAVATVLGKLPLTRLEMQLKRIEIEERRLKLDREKASARNET